MCLPGSSLPGALSVWPNVYHQMVDQMEAWADELGSTYELTMFGKRTVVATEVADVRRVLNLRPSVFKRGLSAVSHAL